MCWCRRCHFPSLYNVDVVANDRATGDELQAEDERESLVDCP